MENSLIRFTSLFKEKKIEMSARVEKQLIFISRNKYRISYIISN